MIAGSDIENGCASSLTDRPSFSTRRARSARRVGSESAAKVRSSVSSLYLTMWFSIDASGGKSSERGQESLGGTNAWNRRRQMKIDRGRSSHDRSCWFFDEGLRGARASALVVPLIAATA